MAVTPQTPKCHHNRGVHLGVCGVTAMTENEVSISFLSWYHKINFKLGVFIKPNWLSAAQV